jgi:hypothetical protein
MARGERSEWLVPTLTLCGVWLAVSVAAIAVLSNAFLRSVIPGYVAKTAPYLISGFITGRLVDVSGRRRKIIACAVLAAVSAAAWTLFSFATSTLAGQEGLVLLALSLPIGLALGTWAYLGMYWGGRRRERWTGHQTNLDPDPELAGLERKLRDRMAREPGSQENP